MIMLCIRQAVNVTAITMRKNAILEDIFSGHEGHWTLGALPKEGSVFNAVNSRYGNVKAVHMPHSGIGWIARKLMTVFKKDVPK